MLDLEGVWTHLPVADGEQAEDRAYTEGQLDLFDRLVADLATQGVAAPVLHAANTAAAIAFPRSRYDMVRCGLGLYGYLPGDTVHAAFDAQAGGDRLRPAMSLKARVVAVRTLDAGERPSYGRLRPLPARVAGRDGAHRLRRRRAPRASSDAGVRGADRRGAAARWPGW